MLYNIHDIIKKGFLFWCKRINNNIYVNNNNIYASMLEHIINKEEHNKFLNYSFKKIKIDSFEINIKEDIVVDLPFAKLRRVIKDGIYQEETVLIIPPHIGYYPNMIRETIYQILYDHSVFVVEWKNAKDINLFNGIFGMDEYIEYIINFIIYLRKKVHIVAIGESGIPLLASIAILEKYNKKISPKSLTLIGSKIDSTINESLLDKLIKSHNINWFKESLIHSVPNCYGGAGRKVYPGFIHLSFLMSMNMHKISSFFEKIPQDSVWSESHNNFYSNYTGIIDVDAALYIDTISKIFYKPELSRCFMEYRKNIKIDCSYITDCALLTIEGEKDIICTIGQTAAAHNICKNLNTNKKQHYIQKEADHFNLFSSDVWTNNVYPFVRTFIRNNA